MGIFASMHVCASCACLVTAEARRQSPVGSPGTRAVDGHMGAGNQARSSEEASSEPSH